MSNIQVPPPGMFSTLYDRYLLWLDELGSGKRLRWALGSLALAAVLIALASLSFLNLWEWIYVVIGAPAGLILFLNLVGLAYFTRLSETGLVAYKETYPPARRVRDTAIGVIAFLVLLLVAGTYIIVPKGVGGALIILVALTAFNIVRRTPDEIRYSVAGLPDPREIREDDDSDVSPSTQESGEQR